MYLWMIVLLMGALPVLSILLEFLVFQSGSGLLFLIGKWFVFWSVGVRLLAAGLKQVMDPAFTAERILDVKDKSAFVVIQELGFANIAIGVLGIFAGSNIWVTPGALVGAVFLGLAGLNHVRRSAKSRAETIAMVSDLAIAAILTVYLIAGMLGYGAT